MLKLRPLLLSATAVLAGSAFLAIAAFSADPARPPAPSLTSPVSPEKAPDANGFIQRWLLLEPIPASGLTDSVVQAAVKKEYFPNQFTVIPRDGDKVTVGGAEVGAAVDVGTRVAVGAGVFVGTCVLVGTGVLVTPGVFVGAVVLVGAGAGAAFQAMKNRDALPFVAIEPASGETHHRATLESGAGELHV